MVTNKVLKRLAFTAGILLTGAVAAGKCEVPLDPGWIECESLEKTEQKAIDNALKRGIGMVFGIQMDAVDLSKSFASESNVSTPVGEASIQVSSESMQSEMSKEIHGSVKQWKLISVTPEKDLFRAHIHALIVNPRAGIEAVIMLAPPRTDLATRTEVVKIGPKKSVSGAEICNVVESSLASALSGSKKFKIVTAGDLGNTAASTKLAAKMVGQGLAPATELLEAGKALTADYVLTTRLDSLSYKKVLGMDKKTKKFGPQYSLKIVLEFQMTNVRLGTSAGNDTVTLSLDSQEISDLLEQDEDADLLRTAFGALVDPLRGWIKKNAK